MSVVQNGRGYSTRNAQRQWADDSVLSSGGAARDMSYSGVMNTTALHGRYVVLALFVCVGCAVTGSVDAM
jgi:hypothetical protein